MYLSTASRRIEDQLTNLAEGIASQQADCEHSHWLLVFTMSVILYFIFFYSMCISHFRCILIYLLCSFYLIHWSSDLGYYIPINRLLLLLLLLLACGVATVETGGGWATDSWVGNWDDNCQHRRVMLLCVVQSGAMSRRGWRVRASTTRWSTRTWAWRATAKRSTTAAVKAATTGSTRVKNARQRARRPHLPPTSCRVC